MAVCQKASPATVLRIRRKHELQPHRVDRSNSATIPIVRRKCVRSSDFILTRPIAIVLNVDAKNQVQALGYTQPILPLRAGLPERQTHDYQRYGRTTLRAALNVLEGTVTSDYQRRHRHQEFLRFLDRVDQSIDADLDIHDIHLVLDNYGTHKDPEVRSGLALDRAITSTSLDQFLLAQSGRALARRDYPLQNPARHLSQCPGTDQSDPRLHPDLQQHSAPLLVGRQREADHPKSHKISNFRARRLGQFFPVASASQERPPITPNGCFAGLLGVVWIVIYQETLGLVSRHRG